MEQVIFKYLRAEPEDHNFLMVRRNSGAEGGSMLSVRLEDVYVCILFCTSFPLCFIIFLLCILQHEH